MKNKLILHIGSPKTGTTAIQNFLYNNQDLLREKGYSYPIIQEEKFFPINGSSLYNYVINQSIPDIDHIGWKDFWQKTREELKKNNVIISWEGMFGYNTQKFFSAVKNEYDNIQIVVYLRRQDTYVESTWNQGVKFFHNWHINFIDYVKIFKWDYLDKLNVLLHIFGKDNIKVRIYEKEQFQGNRKDVISDFMYALGIDIDWNRCVDIKPTNFAMFGNMIEIKLRMNLYLDCKINECFNIENIFHNYLSQINTRSYIKHADGMFTPQERVDFMKQFEEENAEIARKYLGREDGILFYNNKPIPMHKLNLDTFCDDIKNVLMLFIIKWQESLPCNRCENTNDLFKQTYEFMLKLQSVELQINNDLDNIKKSVNVENEDFKEKYLSIIDKYIPFILELYREKYIRYKQIKEYWNKKQENKKHFLFGTGGYCKDIIRELDYLPDDFLDNDKDKTGQEFYNKKIMHPSQITNWSNGFVIIAVKKLEIIETIEKQLQGYGLQKDMDYVIATDFLGLLY